jgi:glycosyltransferase involved in cell wall biosynthesis
MNRYADALVQPSVDPDIRVRSFGLPPAERASRLERQGRQWVTGPVRLRRAGGDVVHLVDHSEAHLLRVLKTGHTVVTCHDLLMLQALAGELPYDPPRRWASRFRWSVSFLARAAAVVCVSEATRKDVLRFLDVDPERLHVIPQAVSERFHPLTKGQRRGVRASLGTGGRHIILHVSSGGFYKNNATVIRVVADLHNNGLDVGLVRVGAPLAEAERSLVRRLGLEATVLDQGWVSDERLNDLYSAADLLLFPSSGEGFGWPVLEAMTCALPVVASSIPPLVDLGGDAILHAPPAEVEKLAAAAASVLTDPTLADQLRASGRTRAMGYRWDHAIASYSQLYRKVADDRALAWGG